MSAVLLARGSLLAFAAVASPTEAETAPTETQTALADLEYWCPNVDDVARHRFASAYAERKDGDREELLKTVDAVLDLTRELPVCSPMHALRGVLQYDIAKQRATSTDVVGTKLIGKAIYTYDPAANYVEIRGWLAGAKHDLQLAVDIEEPAPSDGISIKLAGVEDALRRVDEHLARRRREFAGAAADEAAERIREQSRAARIWGGVAVVGGGLAGALGMAFLRRGLVEEELDCDSGRCRRDFRRASIVGGSAASLASGALLGIGLHQLIRSRRLLMPDGPFPERPVGVVLILSALAPLAIGTALVWTSEIKWDKTEVSDAEAWQSANRRMNIGWAVLGLVPPLVGSGTGLRRQVRPLRPSASLHLAPTVKGVTVTLLF